MRLRLAWFAPVALCVALPAAAAELTFQRFVAPGGSVLARRTALSPDARHLYAVNAAAAGGIVVYERDRTSGSLGFVEAHVKGPGDLSYFSWPTEAIVTADGAFVIAATDSALYVFQRDATTGALTFVEREIGGYLGLPLTTLVLTQSSDGAHVYAGTHPGRIFLYSRDATSGELTYVESTNDSASDARHFNQVSALAISPDGAFVHAASADEEAITLFARDATTGALEWLGDESTFFGGPYDLEITPDGTRLFASGLQSNGDAEITVYSRNVATSDLISIGSTTYAVASDFPVTAIEPDGSHVFGTSTSAIVSVLTDNGDLGFDTEWPPLEDGVAGVALPVDLRGISVSPDGRHAYATGDEGSIAVFAVATYDFLEAEQDDVFTPGLVSVSSVALSGDGENLYATGAGEDAIQVFSRDRATGAISGSQIVRDGVAGVAGLDGARDVVVSPNGAFVYVASANDDAAVAFARNAAGSLTFVNAEFDGAGGANGLDGAFALAISPDGKNVYVASDVDDAIAIFGVVAGTGALTPAGFFQDGVGGANGLAAAQSVAVSPDGKHVYVGGRLDDAIAVFARDPLLGTLQFQTAVTGAGLDSVTDVTVSPDGAFVYATGFEDDALVRFDRNPTTGALSNPDVRSHAAGVVDGLNGARSVEISRDGRRLFVTGDVGSVVAIYRRDPDNGVLRLIQAEVDGARTGDALAGVRATAVSRDGRHLYAAAPIDNAVVAFVPEPEAASLALIAAITVGFIRRMEARA